MDPDKYQQAWQTYSSQTRVTVDADAFLNAVQRKQREMRLELLIGECSEIGTSLLMLPVQIYMGVRMALPWTWYLMVLASIWSIGITVVGRSRHTRKPNVPGEPLLKSVTESLAGVEQLIEWTRNHFWRVELPTAVAMLAFLCQLAWLDARDTWNIIGPALGLMLMVVALDGTIYFMNQRVLRTQHEPQRQELLALLTSLSDETTSEVSRECPILTSAKRVECSPRRLFVASLIFWAIMLIVVAGILIAFSRIASSLQHPQKPPFGAVH